MLSLGLLSSVLVLSFKIMSYTEEIVKPVVLFCNPFSNINHTHTYISVRMMGISLYSCIRFKRKR